MDPGHRLLALRRGVRVPGHGRPDERPNGVDTDSIAETVTERYGPSVRRTRSESCVQIVFDAYRSSDVSARCELNGDQFEQSLQMNVTTKLLLSKFNFID